MLADNKRYPSCSILAMLRFLLAFLSFATVAQSLGRTQSSAVEGILMCGDEPARSVSVKMYEHDTCKTFFTLHYFYWHFTAIGVMYERLNLVNSATEDRT